MNISDSTLHNLSKTVMHRGRVAIYLPSLRGGGAERVAVLLAQGIAQHVQAVDLVLASAEGPYLNQVKPPVRVVNLESSRVLSSLPRLVRYLRNERPDSMLSLLGHANVVALLARRLTQLPHQLVVSEHNHLHLAVRHSPHKRARVVSLLARQLYPSADWVVAVSNLVAADLQRLYRVPAYKIRVIYNPVVVPDCVGDGSLEISKNSSSLVLGAGRLVPQKNFETLIRAFGIVCQERNAQLTILGEGPERSRLEHLVSTLNLQSHVALPGFVEDPFSYMRAASVFVLSSRWEGFGNVLVEALACNTPVVATDIPSAREILEDGKWGILVPVGDANSMAEAILQTLQTPPQVDLTERAKAFSLERAVEAYLDVLGAKPR